MNLSIPREERYVVMRQNRSKVYAAHDKQDIRFLEVWINAQMNNQNQIKHIKGVIEDFIKITKGKRASTAQFQYVYNNVIILRV